MKNSWLPFSLGSTPNHFEEVELDTCGNIIRAIFNAHLLCFYAFDAVSKQFNFNENLDTGINQWRHLDNEEIV